MQKLKKTCQADILFFYLSFISKVEPKTLNVSDIRTDGQGIDLHCQNLTCMLGRTLVVQICCHYLLLGGSSYKDAVCPRSLDTFHKTYLIKWSNTSWTFSKELY